MATLALVGLSVAAAAAWYNSRGIAQPEHIAPPATTLDAIGLLARVSAWSLTETVKSWRPGDLTLGLYTTTRKDGRMWQLLGELLEEAPAGMCEVGTDPEWADSLILLLKLISYSTMLARSRKEPEKSSISRLCDKVRAMQADVLAFKLKSGMLRPAYILLRDWELQEIILVVRGTYTLKDTVTSLMGTTVPHHMLENVADGAAADGVRLVMGHAHGGMLTAARELATRGPQTIRTPPQIPAAFKDGRVGSSTSVARRCAVADAPNATIPTIQRHANAQWWSRQNTATRSCCRIAKSNSENV